MDIDGQRYTVLEFDPPAPGARGATLRVLQSTPSWPWPVPAPAEARKQLARMLTPAPPDDRAWKERYAEFAETARVCDPLRLLDFARTQWSRSGRPTFAEAQISRQLVAMVVDPVAEALQMQSTEVMKRVRAVTGEG